MCRSEERLSHQRWQSHLICFKEKFIQKRNSLFTIQVGGGDIYRTFWGKNYTQWVDLRLWPIEVPLNGTVWNSRGPVYKNVRTHKNPSYTSDVADDTAAWGGGDIVKPINQLSLSWRYWHILPSFYLVSKCFQLTVSDVFLFHAETKLEWKKFLAAKLISIDMHLHVEVFRGRRCTLLYAQFHDVRDAQRNREWIPTFFGRM